VLHRAARCCRSDHAEHDAGTVSANSRKLRVSWGTVAICCCDTVVADFRCLDFDQPCRPYDDLLELRLRGDRLTTCVRSSVAVEATVRVTTASVPGPESTR